MSWFGCKGVIVSATICCGIIRVAGEIHTLLGIWGFCRGLRQGVTNNFGMSIKVLMQRYTTPHQEPCAFHQPRFPCALTCNLPAEPPHYECSKRICQGTSACRLAERWLCSCGQYHFRQVRRVWNGALARKGMTHKTRCEAQDLQMLFDTQRIMCSRSPSQTQNLATCCS